MAQRSEVFLVDSAILVNRDSTGDLVDRYDSEGEFPMLQGDGRHDYFTLIRVKTPFEIAGHDHPIYSRGNRRRQGSEELVVARISSPGMATIGADGSWKKEPQVLNYEEVHGQGGMNEGGYRIVTGHSFSSHYLVTGEREVLDQLKVWGIGKDKVGDLVRPENALPF
jgi:hypothetical protein